MDVWVYATILWRGAQNPETKLVGADIVWKRLTIGRARDNILVLDDFSVSEHHAVIEQIGDDLFITAIDGVVNWRGNTPIRPGEGRQPCHSLTSMLFGEILVDIQELPLSRQMRKLLDEAVAPFLGAAWPPQRAQMEAVLSCAEVDSCAALPSHLAPEEAQELWERLASRDLIPQEWLFTHAREFRAGGALGLYPGSIQQAALIATAPQSILTAEAIIPELLYSFAPWGVSGAKHVVWSAELSWGVYADTQPSILERVLEYVLPNRRIELAKIRSLCEERSKSLAKQAILPLASLAWWWSWLSASDERVELNHKSTRNKPYDVFAAVQSFPMSTDGVLVRELPNPFEPLRRLLELGVQVKHLSPRSDEIELCLVV